MTSTHSNFAPNSREFNMASSSFKKKLSSKPSHPRGCRPSLYNAQLLVSSGVPSMDSLLGGGLAVGTVLLVEEDAYGLYSRLLFKYFQSEGVMCGHSLFLASASNPTQEIMKDLPGAVNDEQTRSRLQTKALKEITVKEEEEEEEEGKRSDASSQAMKIAWRYRNMPRVQSSFSNQFGHSYDLTVGMPAGRIQAIDTVHFNAQDKPARSAQELYVALKTAIEKTIQEAHFSVDEVLPKQRNILRVGIQSLGSPLWLDEGGVSSNSSHSLLQFLHCLRALLRRAYAVAMVTIPTHLMRDRAYVRRLRRLCDSVVGIESFAGSSRETNPMFKDYHGLFHIHKLPCVNALTTHHPETMDLAFKLRRKKFSIEKLHLPPELSETASRTQEDVIAISKSNVASNSRDKTSRGKTSETRRKLTAKDIDF